MPSYKVPFAVNSRRLRKVSTCHWTVAQAVSAAAQGFSCMATGGCWRGTCYFNGRCLNCFSPLLYSATVWPSP